MNSQTDLMKPAERAAIELVTDTLTSEHSKRAYARAITDFLAWRGDREINKALVNKYRQTLKGSPSSINLRMSAIRKLAAEAADNGLLDQAVANGIKRVSGVKPHGERSGMWLTKAQAQKMLNAPQLVDGDKRAVLKGYRDRAILAVMIGAGLRRSEVAVLTFDHIQQRDSRWVIVDLVGKAKHVRSVPIPAWVKLAVDEWQTLADIRHGFIFRAIHKGGQIAHDSVTPQAIRDVVKQYGAAIGEPELAAHDLRRTYAKLAYKGGAGLDQIQLSLGHLSIKTTERYLGVSQSLTDAPGDRLGLTLE
jgi:integrase